MRKLLLLTLALASALAVASACDDTTGPGFAPVPEEPGEATVFDFENSPVRDPSAFDAVAGVPVRPDQTPEWDFVFSVRDDGTAELRPRGAVVDDPGSEAGLQVVDRSFSDLREAPEGGYATGTPVQVEEGTVLAGRSRQDPGFGITCPHFYKMEILELDRDEGTITFSHLINPACSRRNLVPGSSNRD